MRKLTTLHGLVIGGAAALSMMFVTGDARATDVNDNLIVRGFGAGSVGVGVGMIPGTTETGMWRTDNPMIGSFQGYNLLFRTNQTRLTTPDPNGDVQLMTGDGTELLFASKSSGSIRVGIGVSSSPGSPSVGKFRRRP